MSASYLDRGYAALIIVLLFANGLLLVHAASKDIVSTIPGNKYASFNGTSMASTDTAGVAALQLGRYPFATALDVKQVIMVSTNQCPGLTCALPVTVNAFQDMLKMQKL